MEDALFTTIGCLSEGQKYQSIICVVYLPRLEINSYNEPRAGQFVIISASRERELLHNWRVGAWLYTCRCKRYWIYINISFILNHAAYNNDTIQKPCVKQKQKETEFIHLLH